MRADADGDAPIERQVMTPAAVRAYKEMAYARIKAWGLWFALSGLGVVSALAGENDVMVLLSAISFMCSVAVWAVLPTRTRALRFSELTDLRDLAQKSPGAAAVVATRARYGGSFIEDDLLLARRAHDSEKRERVFGDLGLGADGRSRTAEQASTSGPSGQQDGQR